MFKRYDFNIKLKTFPVILERRLTEILQYYSQMINFSKLSLIFFKYMLKRSNILSLNKIDAWYYRENEDSQYCKVIDKCSYCPSMWPFSHIADRIDDSPNEHSEAQRCSRDWEVYSSDCNEGQCRGNPLDVVVMGPLCGVKLVPLLVTEFVGIPPWSHVWVSAFLDLLVKCLHVLFPKVLLHELWCQ